MLQSFVKTAVAVSIFSLLSTQAAAQSASATAVAQAIQTLACYSNAGSLVKNGAWTYQSSGYCKDQCVPGGHHVMAITQGSTCYCGDELPADSYQVSSDKCNSPCDGFDQETCGGNGYWQFYLTGLGSAPQGDSSSSSSSAHSSASTTNSVSVITQAGQTIIVTASATGTSNDNSGGSGTNKIGIAVGVVVGLLVVASVVGGGVLFLKRRRRQAIEEEHRRNAAVSSFVSGGKSETSSLPDQRLDASAIAARRQSIGSIADEMDYTRRILQVRNPDRESRASAMA